MSNTITKSMAYEFMRDLYGTISASSGKEYKPNSGVMSAGLVADYLCISTEKANAYLWACCRYGYSDRQSSMFVI